MKRATGMQHPFGWRAELNKFGDHVLLEPNWHTNCLFTPKHQILSSGKDGQLQYEQARKIQKDSAVRTCPS